MHPPFKFSGYGPDMSPNMADSNGCYTLEAEIGVSAMYLYWRRTQMAAGVGTITAL